MGGALAGAAVGKQLGGTELLAAFGAVMVAIGFYLLLANPQPSEEDVKLTHESAAHLLPRLLLIGVGVGLLSGFFGIGGGFLIVPGLILATGMRLQNAIGTSLFAVTVFGVVTALSYAASGLVDWRITALVIAGGIFGTLAGAGAWANKRLGDRRRTLSTIFAAVVISAGFYVIGTGAAGLLATR